MKAAWVNVVQPGDFLDIERSGQVRMAEELDAELAEYKELCAILQGGCRLEGFIASGEARFMSEDCTDFDMDDK